MPAAKREALLGLRIVLMTLVAGAAAGGAYFFLSTL
jgi:hypothetical protein